MAATKEAHSMPVSDEKPADAVVQQVLDQEVKDQEGNAHSIRSLIGDPSDAASRTVVVFIRHFYCSFCQEYVRSLSRDLAPSKLSALSPPAKLVIIGHGDPALIGKYGAETGSAFPIYAEPTRKAYDRLGFVSNLKGVLSPSSPDYVRKSKLGLALDTLRGYVLGGSKMFSSGKVDQNGGELVFTGHTLDFIHRMKTTADHVEPKDLEAILAA